MPSVAFCHNTSVRLYSLDACRQIDILLQTYRQSQRKQWNFFIIYIYIYIYILSTTQVPNS